MVCSRYLTKLLSSGHRIFSVRRANVHTEVLMLINHGLELDFNLLNDSVDLSKYKSSGEFELVTVTAKREVLEYRYVSTLFALWAKQFYVVSNGSTLFNVVGAESLGVFTGNA